MTIYKNNFEHLLDELHRIDLILTLCIEKTRKESSDDMDNFRGLYISEKEVDVILQTLPNKSNDTVYSDKELERIEKIREEISRKKVESLKQGKELRLHLLSGLFHLQPFEIDALLVCLASELDLRYEKIYSYMQNDVTRKRPTVDLVIRLLCLSLEERSKARKFFSQSEPLMRKRLIHLSDDDRLPLLSRSIKIDERIINFLLGNDEIDPIVRNFTAIKEPVSSFDDLILADETKSKLLGLITNRSDMKIPILFFHGPYGSGKKMAAGAICMELGKPMLVVDSKALKGAESIESLKLITREAMLQGSALFLEGFDVILEKDAGANMTNLIRELDQFPDWVFMSGVLPWEPRGLLEYHGFANLALPLPTFILRKKLWESFLNGNASEEVDISALASKFKFSGGQIKDAIFTARNISLAKKAGPKLSTNDLYLGCNSQSNKNLSLYAKRIEPRYTWDDIVLPNDIKVHLKEVSGYIRHKGTVYADWGFDRKLSLGKGLNVLFSGPSGTGKTMAAEIIAKDAGLDLYKIDLSCVVSKYIGETEKNLNNIFKEAQTSNSILFFDEADALFGKRSEVSDSHDRYANIEINYLLQKMEEHEGVVILATNLRRNMDEAFARRIHIVVEFPFPDKEYRLGIWKKAFPSEAPIDDKVDFDILSHELKLSGGNIKNIALAAAFYAAEDGRVIRMPHMMQAARREYQKLGRTWKEFQYVEKAVPP
ncbi:MAG TPA: AAA family ATPase [candidate division Zixibacteria bacterium]|nr:AAA family ATPase [candidate division Zixibacteria bacterium]